MQVFNISAHEYSLELTKFLILLDLFQPTPTPLRPTSTVTIENGDSVHTEFTVHLEPEGGEYENAPEINHNIVRSSDSHEHDYVPSAGAANSSINK